MGEAAVSISDRSTKTRTVTSKQQSAERAELSDVELVQAGYRYALSIARHHQDAEDLVQQVWIKLSRAYGKVEGTPVFSGRVEIFFTTRKGGAKSFNLNRWIPIREMDVPIQKAFPWT